ncbi:MAG: ATP-dependent RNA helicase [Spirochaetaceae bacterium]|jgi:RNA helicase HrpA|nr:ATP-dependent RNA helicase [Spirochaetaceae bacterium]
MKYTELPVYKHKDLILQALSESQVVVVESPTGSGKTTQLPVILNDAGFAKNGMIGITQPRRIAALSVSEFIARQLGSKFPGLVGYKMRFADLTDHTTKIKIMTDGILLQEMKLDPWLSKYDCILVDEAHERSLTIDFILGLLKRILEARHDFKVIVSSATINAEVFSEYFSECPIVRIDAVSYPVTLIYDPPAAVSSRDAASELLLEKIVKITERFLSEKRSGDILIFLPGEKLIKDCMARLAASPLGKKLYLVPLYGRLGKEEQERVFEKAPWGKTKALVSTNIAETSVTIDGISAVIDSGLSKLNFYNPRNFTSSLVEGPISKASANQRKGRAGRTREGSCYRLYTRRDFENRPLFTTEEIYRTDLSEVVLEMADLGITTFEEFNFISPPGREGLISAVETLNLLDALEPDNSLSKIGKMMTRFPLSPRQSRMIVEAILKYPEVTEETIIAAAFLSTQSPYILPPGEETDARRAHHSFRDNDGDFVSYLKLFRAYKTASDKKRFCEKYYLDERAMAEIANVIEQLELIVSEMGVPILSGGSVEDYLCAVSRGLIQFVCEREGRDFYRSLTADHILIHPGSVMFKMDPQYIVAGEIIRTARMYASSVSPLSRSTLEKIGGDLISKLGFGKVKGGKDKKDPPLVRDWTNNIKIGSEVFEVTGLKGKKLVRLPWERLSKLTGENGEMLYKGLKGVILLKEGYTLLDGEKLNLILAIAPTLDIDGALGRTVSKKEFNSSRDLKAILALLPLVLCPAIWKKGKKELGFICLTTNGEGNYRLRCLRAFHNALNESLSSVESLIDELGEETDLVTKNIVNTSYRRLSDYLA